MDKTQKNELGRIKEKNFSFRTLIPIYDNVRDFKLFSKDNNLIGELQSSDVFWKRRYKLSLKDWKIDFNFLKVSMLSKTKKMLI